ncbi:MAG: N-acetylmuramoyl-L-alanine amidase, partial [Schleiferiaceae bacterium]|nr:N-acetylmuramoyl-L-alanine amidase [Schleiferiaceae bacterium]
EATFMKSVTKSSTYQRLAWLLIALLAIPHAGFQPAARMSDEIRTVVIDAGHGGKDPGNLGTRRYKKTEKDVSLAVALLVEKYILERHPNIKVVMTRRDDSYPTLHERTVIANRAQGDVFISIHCDAAENRSAYGSSTYVMGKDHDDENRVAMRENSVILQEDNQNVYEGFDPTKPESYIMLTMFQYAFIQQSVELAQQVQNSFRDDVGRKDRGVKQQPLYVTSRSAMPAILIELGFLTNSAEEDYLITEQGQDEMARSIARSFGQYKLRREGGASAAAEPKVEPKLEAKVEPKVEPAAEPTALAVQTISEPKAEPAKAEDKPAPAPGTSSVANKDVFFSIQLSVSGIQKNPTEEPFSALPDVFVAKDGRLFRYLQGRYRSRTEAINALESARKSGFADAFVVAYRGLARITLDEADQALKP